MKFNSLAAILTVSVVVRLIIWAMGLLNPESYSGGDTAGYWALAENPFAAYGASSGDLYGLGLARPPGYPVLLALLRLLPGGMATAALGQTIFGVLGVWLTVLLGRRLLGSTEAAIAGWWLAVEPLHAIESSLLLTEIPFSVALLAALLAAHRGLEDPHSQRWWLLTGLALSAATLIRPITLYLPVLAIFVLLVARRRRVGWRASAVSALVFGLAVALPLGAWAARNGYMSGVATFTTIQGLNLSNYRAVGALIESEGMTTREARDLIGGELDTRKGGETDPAVVSEIQARLGLEIILEHPWGYAVSAGKGMAITLAGPGRAHIGDRMSGLPAGDVISVVTTVASGISAIAMTSLAFVTLVRWIRHRAWVLLGLMGLPLFYLLVVGSGYESYSRFRLQMAPLLLLMAADTLATWMHRPRRLGSAPSPRR